MAYDLPVTMGKHEIFATAVQTVLSEKNADRRKLSDKSIGILCIDFSYLPGTLAAALHIIM